VTTSGDDYIRRGCNRSWSGCNRSWSGCNRSWIVVVIAKGLSCRCFWLLFRWSTGGITPAVTRGSVVPILTAAITTAAKSNLSKPNLIPRTNHVLAAFVRIPSGSRATMRPDCFYVRKLLSEKLPELSCTVQYIRMAPVCNHIYNYKLIAGSPSKNLLARIFSCLKFFVRHPRPSGKPTA
jgi:hypothetical protein